jgi:hypothetical protein
MEITADGGAFRAIKWALNLPMMRTAKGHADDKLKLMALALAQCADGDTGENAYRGLTWLAKRAQLSTPNEAADVLARGEELGLWWTDGEESEWGTTIWHLNLDDPKVYVRLEEAELARTERKRTNRAATNRRQYVSKGRGVRHSGQGLIIRHSRLCLQTRFRE